MPQRKDVIRYQAYANRHGAHKIPGKERGLLFNIHLPKATYHPVNQRGLNTYRTAVSKFIVGPKIRLVTSEADCMVNDRSFQMSLPLSRSRRRSNTRAKTLTKTTINFGVPLMATAPSREGLDLVPLTAK